MEIIKRQKESDQISEQDEDRIALCQPKTSRNVTPQLQTHQILLFLSCSAILPPVSCHANGARTEPLVCLTRDNREPVYVCDT